MTPGPVAAAVVFALALGVGGMAFGNGVRVSFPSLDGAGGAPVVLTAVWFPAPSPVAPAPIAPASPTQATATPAVAPAVILLHGCGGVFDRRGAMARRYLDYAALLNGRGVHALVVDSLSPRYETELCTQRTGTRRVTQANRRRDALGAIAYLAGRADVDPRRIGLVGWSHGGSTVLSATNLRLRDVADTQTRPAFAVAFYPGCETDLKRGYEASAPLLLLVGALDDWTPAAPCRALANEAGGVAAPEIETYAGAHHGFDGEAPVRLRRDVPNGAHPGRGVHVGGNAAARAASRERLLKFIAPHLPSS